MKSKHPSNMSRRSDIVTTTHDARKFIEGIARNKGAFTDAFRKEAEREANNGREGMLQAMAGSDEIRKELARSLVIISNDLYTSDTRFLMEIIQNADDNKYDKNETPTVSITVFPERVKIECNEVGFSKDNVQALCRTGRSSKLPGEGYTGEKGIGFKSVFKLANQAHIRSHPYYFQLDQRRDLGIVTPLWDEKFFDDHKKEHQTTIVLDHIRNGSRDFSTSLRADLNTINPVLILFLRRIERLHLVLYECSHDDEPAIDKCFRRINWTCDSGFVLLKDENCNTKRRFYKQNFTANFSGTESQRPGMTKVEIVLAFPVRKYKGTYHPTIQKQNPVFAWLPLMDCGFKFILQSDFLTTSNRQSVDETCDWNKNIANAIPSAMEAAVKEFNQGDSSFQELARLWPLYLKQDSTGQTPYWLNITKSINLHLSNSLIVKDQTGCVRRPSDLMFMDWAHDHEAKPMFGSECDYVSTIYPSGVREALLSLGVTAPTWKWLCKKLQELHKEELLEDKMHSAQWCSDLARVILESLRREDTTRYVMDLRRIPLIPLSDGTWRCAPSEDDPIYFPASQGTSIPPGLPLSLVEEEAFKCPERRQLFQYLGVKDCNVPSVIERIFDYHTKIRSANPNHLIAQVQYLYKFKDHLQPDAMQGICFSCSVPRKILRKGNSTYADNSAGGELKELFIGCGEVYFLNELYFVELGAKEKANFAEWLQETAGIALAPRFISSSGHMHPDFKWLLDHRRGRILATLHQYWNHYERIITPKARATLADHPFLCMSGSTTVLSKTFLPLRGLVEKTQEFTKANQCDFLKLPNGEPEDWMFLSELGVNLKDGLDYYLWVLCQSGFQKHANVAKSKRLYLAIQSCCFSPDEVIRVQKAFGNSPVALPNGKSRFLTNCVWIAPEGFSSKPALFPIYEFKLDRFFVDILGVPNVTSAEAQGYLKQLEDDVSTTLAQVEEVYIFLQTHHIDTCEFDEKDTCIAVPTGQGSNIAWKKPAECVWEASEFQKNGLQLESKTALHFVVTQKLPRAVAFFRNVLKLPNAGIKELLADLKLMQKEDRDDPKRVYRLYEMIQNCRRSCEEDIVKAFKSSPLVFLHNFDKKNGQWLSLEDCIWGRSKLRNKYALKPSLNEFKGLFRDTLQVSNATIGMLVTELLKQAEKFRRHEDEYEYRYIRKLVKAIARLPQDDPDLGMLAGKPCWPCRTRNQGHELCTMGFFYVNDRQNLFNMFANYLTFLDFDFEETKLLTELLRDKGCGSFVSEKASIKTEYCGESIFDRDLTDDFRSRADSLVAYFEHVGCMSPYELRPLLENAEFWKSEEIKTHYTLKDTTVTKEEGGSNVEVCIEKDRSFKLKIHVSTKKRARECALVTDFPGQLMSALKLKLDQKDDLFALLQVPPTSLKALMVRKGFTGNDDAGHSTDEDSQGELESSDEDGLTRTGMSEDHNDCVEPTIIDCVRSSAMAQAAHTSLRPNVRHRLSSSPAPPERQSHDHLDVFSNRSLPEQQNAPRPTAAGIYSADNRNRNLERIRRLARNSGSSTGFRSTNSGAQSTRDDRTFDLNSLSEALDAVEPPPMPAPAQAEQNPPPRGGPIPQRNEEQKARDFEVGFLGEQFVYTLLHDEFRLPGFTADDNWTSFLRARAGFSEFRRREISDFTYLDTEGALTHQFLQMQHHNQVPDWLATCFNGSNVPLYRIEVKSTTSRGTTTPFYMSGAQHKLAKQLRVTSTTPKEIYIIFRVLGLDALEEGAQHQPEWRVYLDPYSRGVEGLLKFNAPTYVVTPAA